MEKWGDFIHPLSRAVVTNDWSNFGHQMLNGLSIACGNWVAGSTSYLSRALSHIGDNATDEMSRVFGYISMTKSSIDVIKNVKKSIDNWDYARKVSNNFENEISQLKSIKEKTPEILEQIKLYGNVKGGVDVVKLGLIVKPVATFTGAVVGAYVGSRSSDGDIKNVLLGALLGSSIGEMFSGTQIGLFNKEEYFSTLTYNINTEQMTGAFGGSLIVRSKFYGMRIFNQEYSGQFAPSDVSYFNKSEFSNREISSWSPLF